MGEVSYQTGFVFITCSLTDVCVDDPRKERAPIVVGGEVTRSLKERGRERSQHRFLYVSQESGKSSSSSSDNGPLVLNTVGYGVE